MNLSIREYTSLFLKGILAAYSAMAIFGCAAAPSTLSVVDMDASFPPGAIVSMDTGAVVSFEEFMESLEDAGIVYVGERHTNPVHHRIQLRIVRALYEKRPDLSIGMEMFDRTYQPVLDLWSAGQLDENEFVKRSHWYANWRYDFALYRDILVFAKENRVPVVALNIPFHIPRKIAAGGVDSLMDDDRKHLPETIDTGIQAHRKYVENVFREHLQSGLEDFEPFYEAQCAWEDAMAESVANRPGSGPIAVLVGNGHIVRKFGIPDRAYARKAEPFKTVYLAPAGESVESDYADYIWVTPETSVHPMMKKMRGE